MSSITYKPAFMKPISLLSFCLLLVLNSFGQGTTPGAKLTAAYSTQQLSAMESAEIEKMNFVADHLCIIQDANEKTASLPVLNLVAPDGTVVPADVNTETFNPILYGIEAQQQNQYYSIANGTKTLFVYSNERLDVLYARFKANQK
jgi:hypothetical protein